MKKTACLLLMSILAFAKDAPKDYNLTLNILQVKQVPFKSGGSSSAQTNCQIIGNNIFCNTQDTSFAGIPGVSYLILATASDGSSYMFGCDAQWRWSHCSGLNLGGPYRARVESGRLAIEAFDNKRKAKEIKYLIYQMAVTNK